jgi:hypothetical protein
LALFGLVASEASCYLKEYWYLLAMQADSSGV